MTKDHPFFFIDSFTGKRYGGNQAAVCLINPPVTTEEHQKLAAEFNLSETSFLVPKGEGDWTTASRFSLRWFTPTVEMPLCGHATLAAAQALFHGMKNTSDCLTFDTVSGELRVRKTEDGFLEMDFPQHQQITFTWAGENNEFASRFPEQEAPAYLKDIIRCLIPEERKIKGVIYTPVSKKLMVVLDGETTKDEFGQLLNHYEKMESFHPSGDYIRGVIVTVGPKDPVKQGFVDVDGKPYDYSCRFFDPWEGVNEDPATGAIQCDLAPFWSKILGKKELRVFQHYPGRGAEFNISLPSSERTLIRGKAVTVVSGTLHL